MRLFQFELRKLLLNKKKLCILLVMFLVYTALGVGSGILQFGGLKNYQTYNEMAEAAVGPYDETLANESHAVYEAALERYGSETAFLHVYLEDPELYFYVNYHNYAERVEEYWNGPDEQDLKNIKGIYPLEEALARLEAEGQSDSYQYQKMSRQLETEKALGEPIFENTIVWENMLGMWGGLVLLILLFFPMSFLVGPVCTVERRTGMDNIILSSHNGQGKIVAAKAGAVAVACLAMTAIYFGGIFLGTFIPIGSLSGIGASARSISSLASCQYGMSVGSFALLNVAWVAVVAVFFGLILNFISSKVSNHAAVAAIGLIVLLFNVVLQALGTTIETLLKPLKDFGFLSIGDTGTIFGGITTYNVFGAVVPFWIMAVAVVGIVSLLMLFALRMSQKYRTVA